MSINILTLMLRFIENIVFKKGMCFCNAKEFRKVVRNYTMNNERRVRFTKETPKKLMAICFEGCDGLIYAYKM